MLRQVEIAGDQVIRLDDGALVSSKSEPGSWRRATATSCECPGFLYRGRCRHIAAVRELERQARAAAIEARRAAIVASVADLFE